MVSGKYADDELSVVQQLFQDGLDNCLNDAAMGVGNPDMFPSYIEELKRTTDHIIFELPNNFEGNEHINSLREYWGMSEDLFKTIIFCVGLGNDGYCYLLYKDKRYRDDAKFKKIVDNMPHDVGLEPDDEIRRT